jgi:hypothetical protein
MALVWGFDFKPSVNETTGKPDVVDTWAYETVRLLLAMDLSGLAHGQPPGNHIDSETFQVLDQASQPNSRAHHTGAVC